MVEMKKVVMIGKASLWKKLFKMYRGTNVTVKEIMGLLQLPCMNKGARDFSNSLSKMN